MILSVDFNVNFALDTGLALIELLDNKVNLKINKSQSQQSRRMDITISNNNWHCISKMLISSNLKLLFHSEATHLFWKIENILKTLLKKLKTFSLNNKTKKKIYIKLGINIIINKPYNYPNPDTVFISFSRSLVL